ncbi:MAG: hypothetical protein EP349_03190 [Alphaproteobacteria bacterium]|nr:MAG: hypothetical protein EP349_03190 [Alphaproteobacteria bacterium]
MSVLSFPLIRYVLTAALRDKIVITIFLMIAIGAATASFLGAASVAEQQELAVVFGAGGLRFLGALGTILFCCFHIRRSFEHKEVEFLLSRPISRIGFLISHAAAFMIIGTAIAAVISIAVSLIGNADFEGLLLWGSSLAVEYIIIATTALFFSMVISSAAGSALACLGVYVLARLIGMLLGITYVMDNTLIAFLGNIMEIISIIIPRLDLMAQTSWLVYGLQGMDSIEFMGQGGNMSTPWTVWLFENLRIGGFIFFQGLFFTALLLGAAVLDLLKKQF